MEINLLLSGARMRTKMQLCTIASGSSGNAAMVRTESTVVLADCGVSCKRITEGLKEKGVEPEKLSGIFITHEHSDHIKGLRVFLKKYHVPVFSTAGTIDEILRNPAMNECDKGLFNIVRQEEKLTIGDITATCFDIPHDAAEPVGWCFVKDDKKVSVCTDIGIATDTIREHIAGSDAMVIEANHDVRMLEAGSYPYERKCRILGDRGHLSNENSGKLISEIWKENMKYVFLGHLSKENNLPQIALAAVENEMAKEHGDYEIYTSIRTANRDIPTDLVTV